MSRRDRKRIIMTAEDIERAIQRIGLQILERHSNREDLAIVGIHTCGVFLAQRLHAYLVSQLAQDIPFGSLDINLYRDDWSLISQNPVVKTTDILFDVDNAKIVLVDDVIFTGRTIRAAMEVVMDYGRPDTIQLAALVDRSGRELPIQPDYSGMQVKLEADERVNVLLGPLENGDIAPSAEVVIEG